MPIAQRRCAEQEVCDDQGTCRNRGQHRGCLRSTRVAYPAQLWRVVGTLNLDQSVLAGTDSPDAVIPEAADPVTVVGVSQGAVVINYEERRLAAASVPPGHISFVTIGDPTNADGGILAKLPPGHIPLLDFTKPPPPNDTYPTTEIVREHDGPRPAAQPDSLPLNNIRVKTRAHRPSGNGGPSAARPVTSFVRHVGQKRNQHGVGDEQPSGATDVTEDDDHD
ncbi:PE-PPE domain-containing protein [Mycolicibacterium moriokaense]|nr:PE-PPE domain-containing protein [Mycolicibacterium moriokaense]